MKKTILLIDAGYLKPDLTMHTDFIRPIKLTNHQKKQ
jgi:hypothetical protein